MVMGVQLDSGVAGGLDSLFTLSAFMGELRD